MAKFQQTSINQTGITILELANSEEKIIPLFSEKPSEEAEEILTFFKGARIKNTIVTNNLMDYKIENEVKKYKDEHNGALSEDLMNQLASGFPYIEGYEPFNTMECYS